MAARRSSQIGSAQIGSGHNRSGLVTILGIAALGASCASELPFRTSYEDSSGEVRVVLLGDGFVRVAERRMPLETFVLETRWATRQMTRDERKRFVVHVAIAKSVTEGSTARIALRGQQRLMDELQIMGVGYARM